MSRRPRPLRAEPLEDRRLLVAEGAVFELSRTLDAAGLTGSLSSTVRWGDGTQSAGTVTALPATGPLRIRFDYSLDTGANRFFDTQAKRDLLQLAADSLTSRLNDDLAAITPSGSNTWQAVFAHPGTGQPASRDNLRIAANEILVYVAGRNLPGAQRGLGGPGGFGATGTQAWVDTIRARGEAGANANPQTDFGPWGGSVAFDLTDTDWYFGTDPNGIVAGEVDFLTVATHELTHVLGFGFIPPRPTAVSSWENLTSSGSFRGAKAVAAYGGNVPLQSGDRGHWQEGILSNGRETLMDQRIATGARTLLSALDYAALDDIGWDVDSTRVTVTASHVYADNGNFPIEVVLRGGVSGELVFQLSTGVTNVAPELTGPGNQTIVQGETFSLVNLGQISDPGFRHSSATPPTDETFTYTIDWGDQTAPSSGTATIDRVGNANRTTLASFDGSHRYETPGRYTVRLSVRDDDGGTDQATFLVTVEAGPPEFQNPSNRFDVDNSGTVTAGDALLVINALNLRGTNLTLNPLLEDPQGVFIDVTGDYRVSALDALEVIHYLNVQQLIGQRLERGTADAEFATGPVPSREEAYDSALVSLFDENERHRQAGNLLF